ncbi:MAG TPA: hypothetical protein VHI93_01410 [Candidatus Thermoplasmatota archaeon]|nr:hypothetical protein [Candidatus Thermoplasmatota archaeon]
MQDPLLPLVPRQPKTTPVPDAKPELDLLPPPPPPAGAAPMKEAEDDDFNEVLGAIYSDVYQGIGRLYVGAPVPELDDKRAARRGKQLSTVLRRLGWADQEILAYLGLSAGVVSDFAGLQALKAEHEAKKAPAPQEAAA